jgi:hypothetical protein
VWWGEQGEVLNLKSKISNRNTAGFFVPCSREVSRPGHVSGFIEVCTAASEHLSRHARPRLSLQGPINSEAGGHLRTRYLKLI